MDSASQPKVANWRRIKPRPAPLTPMTIIRQTVQSMAPDAEEILRAIARHSARANARLTYRAGGDARR